MMHSLSQASTEISDPLDAKAKYSRDFLLGGTFLLQGIGQLFPYHVFISAVSYFSLRFCSTSFSTNFESWFSFMYYGIGIFSMLFLLRYKDVNQRGRIMTSFCIGLIVFVLNASLVLIDDIADSTFLIITLISLCAISLSSVVLRSSFTSLASNYPPACIHANVAGNAVAGSIVSFTNFVNVYHQSMPPIQCNDISSTGSNECIAYKNDWGTACYFSVAAVVLAVCLYLYFDLLRRPGYSLLKNESSTLLAFESMDNYTSVEELEKEADIRSPIFSALRCVWPLCATMFIVMLFSIAIFPSLIARLQSSNVCDTNAPRWQRDLFTPLMFFLVNIGDLLGRLSAGYFSFLSNKALLILSICRVIFIPCLLMCNILDSELPILFSDVGSIILIALYSYTNGCLFGASFLAVPKCCPHHLRDVVSTMMILFLSAGLFAGSILSFLVYSISVGNLI